MTNPDPLFRKLVLLAIPLVVGGLLTAGAMGNSLASLQSKTEANTVAIIELQGGYGRVDERLKSMKETLDRILQAVEKN